MDLATLLRLVALSALLLPSYAPLITLIMASPPKSSPLQQLLAGARSPGASAETKALNAKEHVLIAGRLMKSMESVKADLLDAGVPQ